jgi:hypothetical protein
MAVSFRNVQASGNWHAGVTYTFEVYEPRTDKALLIGAHGCLFSNQNPDKDGGITSPITSREDIGDDRYRYTLEVPLTTTGGTYFLKWAESWTHMVIITYLYTTIGGIFGAHETGEVALDFLVNDRAATLAPYNTTTPPFPSEGQVSYQIKSEYNYYV